MRPLFTPRLLLWPLGRAMLEARLRQADFVLECPKWRTPARPSLPTVHFGPDWPGDALSAFPYLFTQLDAQQTVPGTFAAVDLRSAEAVGMLGCKGKVNPAGELEIGYGFIPAVWGQGYATEALTALVSHLLEWPAVVTVTAQTAPGNHASEQVLQKTGFDRVGTAHTPQNGKVTSWRYRRSTK